MRVCKYEWEPNVITSVQVYKCAGHSMRAWKRAGQGWRRRPWMEELSDVFPPTRCHQISVRAEFWNVLVHLQSRSPGWCATCVPGANAGQAGYCDPALGDIDVSFQIYEVILVPTRWHSFLPRSTTMNTITKTPKKNLFFTIMLGASVIQNVLSGRKTFLPWICKRCLFVSKSISGQNPHLQVKLWILSEEECRNRTWTHSKAKFRAMVDRSDFYLTSKLCYKNLYFVWLACWNIKCWWFSQYWWLVSINWCQFYGLISGSFVRLTGPRYLLTLTNRREAPSRVFRRKQRCQTFPWDPTNSRIHGE